MSDGFYSDEYLLDGMISVSDEVSLSIIDLGLLKRERLKLGKRSFAWDPRFSHRLFQIYKMYYVSTKVLILLIHMYLFCSNNNNNKKLTKVFN